MKLYQITQEYENIFNQIGDDGEITDDMLSSIESVKHEFEEKAVSVAYHIKNMEAEEQAITDAIKGMIERKTSLSKKIESLSSYLHLNLEKLGINEIKMCPYFKIKLKTCPPYIDVFDENLIPDDYWKEKITLSIDKIKIRESLNNGEPVPGASLQRKIKLEIK